MSALRVLFIGGSGIISSACCRLAVQRGLGLYTLNRGTTRLRPLPLEVTILHGDIRDQASVREALGDHEFDAGSASAYQTPPSRVPVRESTPLNDPYWQYSRDKIACEDRLVRAYREEGFPALASPK